MKELSESIANLELRNCEGACTSVFYTDSTKTKKKEKQRFSQEKPTRSIWCVSKSFLRNGGGQKDVDEFFVDFVLSEPLQVASRTANVEQDRPVAQSGTLNLLRSFPLHFPCKKNAEERQIFFNKFFFETQTFHSVD